MIWGVWVWIWYNLISVWFKKISEIFVCVQQWQIPPSALLPQFQEHSRRLFLKIPFRNFWLPANDNKYFQHIYVYIYKCVYMYIYINDTIFFYTHIHIYIYIYIYIYKLNVYVCVEIFFYHYMRVIQFQTTIEIIWICLYIVYNLQVCIYIHKKI